MNDLLEEKNGVFSVMRGSKLTDTVAEATVLSAKECRPIKFEFNGVIICVSLKSQLGNEGEKANESGGVLNPALLSVG